MHVEKSFARVYVPAMANLAGLHIGAPEDRLAQGRALRKKMGRQNHAQWDAKQRRHDPLKLLQESMCGRVPALVPLKYERMLASPFGYRHVGEFGTHVEEFSNSASRLLSPL